jgi:hypothetical protein
MKIKHVIVLSIVFVLLLIVAYAKKQSRPVVPTVEDPTELIRADIGAESVTEVEIHYKGKQIRCVRSGGSWISPSLYDAPVRAEAIERFLDGVYSLSGDLRSDDPALLADYAISDDEALRIRLRAGRQEVAELLVGAYRAGRNVNFIRRNGSDAVYAASVDLLQEFGLPDDLGADAFLDDVWVDKKLIPIDTDHIEELTWNKAGEIPFTLERDPDDPRKWHASEDYLPAIDFEEVRLFIANIDQYEAQSLLPIQGAYGFDPPEAIFQIGTADSRLTITIGEKNQQSGQYYLSVSGRNYVYTVDEALKKDLIRNIGDFFKHNPFDIRDSRIVQLIITDVENKEHGKVNRSVEPSYYMDGAEEKLSHNTVWRIDDEDKSIIERDTVRQFVKKLEAVRLRLLDIENAAENDPVFVVSIRFEDATSVYTFLESIMHDGQEYSVLMASDDMATYFVPLVDLDALRYAASRMFDEKKKESF